VLFAVVSVGGIFLTQPGDLKRPWLLPVVAVLVAIEGAAAVRIAKGRGHSDSQGHEEALFVFMALAFSPLAALVVVAAGAVVGNVLARRGMLKAIFNIASFTGAAALALTAMDLIAGTSEISGRRVFAVLVGALIFAGMTRVAVSGVLAITLRTSFIRDFLDDLRPATLLFAGDASLGLLAGLAALSYGWTVPFAFAAMLALSFAYSGHAHARRQSQTLNDLVSSSKDGIFLVDEQGLIQLWNPAMSELCAHASEEAIGQPPFAVLDLRDPNGESAASFLTPEESQSPTGGPVESVLRLHGSQGPPRWLRLSRSPLPESGYSYIVRDITAEYEAGEATRQNEERLRLALESGSMGWWERDTLTDEEVWSEGLHAMFGLSPGGFGGSYQDFLACVHPDDRNAVAQATDRALEEGSFAMTHRVLWPDGTIRWIERNGRLIHTGTGQKMIGVSRDVTERKAMEANLLHGQRVEAVGQLAAGIAHDFNNMMTAVNGYSEMALKKLGADDPIRSYVEHIAGAGKRAASLSAQLLTFSSKHAPAPGATDLNAILLGVRQILPTILPAGIALVITAEHDVGTIHGDTGELEQAIVNLAINAGHAMPDGGQLTIEIANVELSAAAAADAGITDRRCVRLAVSDTGIGMDEATRQQIFQPFFTTKTRGEGTGLGLSTVIAIVEQSGGAISVSSTPGSGTTFELLFPRIDDIPGPSEEHTDPFALRPETILLVEDSQAIRTFERLILEEEGYRVLEAGSAAEALRLAASYEGSIQLLLADVAMPGSSGPELALQLEPSRPDMAVIYISGLSPSDIADYGVQPSSSCLFKPLTPDVLAASVRDALNARR
jgi:two-component system cell cycle sensor histidine kinase/response regulator CckA